VPGQSGMDVLQLQFWGLYNCPLITFAILI
jgi:hypothetical protein